MGTGIVLSILNTLKKQEAHRLVRPSDRAGTRTQDPYIKSVLLYQLSYAINHEKATLFWECKNMSKCIDNKFFTIYFSPRNPRSPS